MAINKQTHYLPMEKTMRAIGGNAVAYLAEIMAATAGTASGEDALTLLNRKLESSGVITTGTADPVFANETALFYRNTTSGKLFTRGSTAYDEIEIGIEDDDLIGSGASVPTADADAPWLFVKTDLDGVRIKKRAGSAGAYTYSWAGPYFAGADRTIVVYSTAATAPNITVGWNWINDNLNITGGDWAQSAVNPTWYRIVRLPRNSNTAMVSPAFRVGNPSAADIPYTPPTGAGNLPSTVDNVKKALDDYHNATLGGDGTGTDDQTAAEVPVTTTNFGNLLPTSANNVQLALDAIDNLDTPPFQDGEFISIHGTLNATGIRRALTLATGLTTYRTRFGQPLFIEANAQVDVQATVAGPPLPTLTFVFDLIDSSDTVVMTTEPLTLTASNDTVSGNLRFAGNLPTSFSTGNLRVRRTATTGTAPPLAWIEHIRYEVRPDMKADEIIVDPSDLGNNLTSDTSIENVEDVISQVDELPMQYSDYEDVAWPGTPNAIDDDGIEVSRTIPLHRNVQFVNNRPNHHYIARITYKSSFHDRALGATAVNFVHNVYTNLSSTAIATQTINGQGGVATERELEVAIPANATSLRVGFTVATGQQDARLLVTDYHVAIEEGIDASGFTTSGRILDTDALSLQTLAQQVYDYVPGTGGSDDQNASEIPIVLTPTNPFSDPNDFPGGLRQVTGITGIPDSPDDVRDALIKTDYLLQAAYNPFQAIQALDSLAGGTFSSSFTVNSATAVLSEPVDIPAELRALGIDVDVRIRIRIATLGAGWQGNVQLVNAANTSTFGDAEAVNNTVYDAGDSITFQRTITASQVPDTFRVRFTRTGGTTSTVFHRGFAFVLDSLSAAGGAGGATDLEWELIWEFGPGTADRLTATGIQYLTTGRLFSQYQDLAIWMDAGSGVRDVVALTIPIRLWQETSPDGALISTSDNTWRGLRYRNDNSWIKVWAGGGIRKFYAR